MSAGDQGTAHRRGPRMAARSEASPGFDPARLRAARDSRGWLQETLAERAGVAQSAVSRWERGVQGPGPANLVALADALGIAPHELTDVDPDQARLRDLRVWAGLTTLEMADQLGISHTAVIRYEDGRRSIPEQVLQQLEDLLEVSPTRIRDAAARTRRSATDHPPD